MKMICYFKKRDGYDLLFGFLFWLCLLWTGGLFLAPFILTAWSDWP